MSKLDRKQLIELVHQIMVVSACVTDLDALLNRFEANVEYPGAGKLIFDPPGGKRLTAEEIVDLALRKP